ncbi:hypothetical protein DPMN_066664 [Dreissena polymorpha]|uniref:Uncharacterized protein n=1 Tax=Dreissena polymorpha TaxID=45954 RepID=A0A9D3YZF6_DREPO|nr:hypothetical protein DPMN_066664 [Dreissena polymorpha]
MLLSISLTSVPRKRGFSKRGRRVIKAGNRISHKLLKELRMPILKKKALRTFFQDTKGHNSVINRWGAMPFDVHHPLIYKYTNTKFQYNPPKHFQDMASDGRKDG